LDAVCIASHSEPQDVQQGDQRARYIPKPDLNVLPIQPVAQIGKFPHVLLCQCQIDESANINPYQLRMLKRHGAPDSDQLGYHIAIPMEAHSKNLLLEQPAGSVGETHGWKSQHSAFHRYLLTLKQLFVKLEHASKSVTHPEIAALKSHRQSEVCFYAKSSQIHLRILRHPPQHHEA
jgi:hypothetical protein